jgi:prevent-host-death family protein
LVYNHNSTFKGALVNNAAMLNIAKDIQSLTTFRRSSGTFLKHLRKSKRPMVLTVNGKAAAVVQDAEAYQRLLDMAAQANAGEGIRQGLDDARKGRTRPARQFFDEFEAAHELRR